jgi:hypothetical protein
MKHRIWRIQDIKIFGKMLRSFNFDELWKKIRKQNYKTLIVG